MIIHVLYIYIIWLYDINILKFILNVYINVDFNSTIAQTQSLDEPNKFRQNDFDVHFIMPFHFYYYSFHVRSCTFIIICTAHFKDKWDTYKH